MPTTQVAKGTVLTCGHEGCGCRVEIKEECNCEGGTGTYMCQCGSPLQPVSS